MAGFMEANEIVSALDDYIEAKLNEANETDDRILRAARESLRQTLQDILERLT